MANKLYKNLSVSKKTEKNIKAAYRSKFVQKNRQNSNNYQSKIIYVSSLVAASIILIFIATKEEKINKIQIAKNTKSANIKLKTRNNTLNEQKSITKTNNIKVKKVQLSSVKKPDVLEEKYYLTEQEFQTYTTTIDPKAFMEDSSTDFSPEGMYYYNQMMY